MSERSFKDFVADETLLLECMAPVIRSLLPVKDIKEIVEADVPLSFWVPLYKGHITDSSMTVLRRDMNRMHWLAWADDVKYGSASESFDALIKQTYSRGYFLNHMSMYHDLTYFVTQFFPSLLSTKLGRPFRRPYAEREALTSRIRELKFISNLVPAATYSRFDFLGYTDPISGKLSEEVFRQLVDESAQVHLIVNDWWEREGRKFKIKYPTQLAIAEAFKNS